MRKEVRKRHIFTKQYWWRERERWGKEDEEERERGGKIIGTEKWKETGKKTNNREIRRERR